MRGETLYDRLLERANHHDIDHAGDDARHILDGLSASKLAFSGIQDDRRTSKLMDTRLERDAGPR